MNCHDLEVMSSNPSQIELGCIVLLSKSYLIQKCKKKNVRRRLLKAENALVCYNTHTTQFKCTLLFDLHVILPVES